LKKDLVYIRQKITSKTLKKENLEKYQEINNISLKQ